MRASASGEVVLCTLPVAFSELRLTGRENATKKFIGSCLYQLLTGFLEVKYLQFPEARFDSTSPSGLTTGHPATRMLKTTEKRKMRLGVRVLLRRAIRGRNKHFNTIWEQSSDNSPARSNSSFFDLVIQTRMRNFV